MITADTIARLVKLSGVIDLDQAGNLATALRKLADDHDLYSASSTRPDASVQRKALDSLLKHGRHLLKALDSIDVATQGRIHRAYGEKPHLLIDSDNPKDPRAMYADDLRHLRRLHGSLKIARDSIRHKTRAADETLWTLCHELIRIYQVHVGKIVLRPRSKSPAPGQVWLSRAAYIIAFSDRAPPDITRGAAQTKIDTQLRNALTYVNTGRKPRDK